MSPAPQGRKSVPIACGMHGTPASRVNLLTVDECTAPQNACLADHACTVLVMSMTQLIVSAALGFVIAQSALYGIRYSLAWLRREEVRTRIRAMTPSPGHAFVAGFIRYAAPIGASAALITLGVWAIGDYLAARAARNAALASAVDPVTASVMSPAPNSLEPRTRPRRCFRRLPQRSRPTGPALSPSSMTRAAVLKTATSMCFVSTATPAPCLPANRRQRVKMCGPTWIRPASCLAKRCLPT